jgi:hypothetical protein
MRKKHVLVKLSTGETLIGVHVPCKSRKYTTLENPFIYQIISITNPFGAKIKDLLSFKRWFDFTDESVIPFLNTSIISMVPANSIIISYYEKELANLLDMLQKQQSSTPEEPQIEEPTERPKGGMVRSVNLNLNFDDPEALQMFMETFQVGLDALINDELDIDDEDDEDLEDDDDAPAPQKQPAKRKRAKNRMTPKESFDLPYEKDGDPKDPKSWSNNPEDYLK